MNKLISLSVLVLGLLVTALANTSAEYLTIKEHPQAGQYLANLEGSSLYIFESDQQGTGTSSCYDSCASIWWPYIVDSKDITAAGVFGGELSTITRSDGKWQLAYNGWPLYYYAKDKVAGDTYGNGKGGIWFLAPYTPPPPPPPPPPAYTPPPPVHNPPPPAYEPPPSNYGY